MTGVLTPGNRIDLLETGAEYFPALLAAINAARHEIHLETYIFADDATGRAVIAALIAAAHRGVHVRLLVDGFGARDFPARLGGDLVAAGAEVRVFRPEVARLRLRRHRLRRLHRKLSVIDGSIAFVGGINIIDDLDTPGHTPPRFDYAVSVRGPLVADVRRAVRRLWLIVDWANFGRRLASPAPGLSAPPPCGDVPAALLVRDNLRHRRDIEDAYLEAITNARGQVLLANAYFLPGRRFRHALTDAARRGVDVIVLLQGRVEYLLLHYATQALYGSLIAGGVRIVEYRKSFLHAKVAVIDDRWATVGSSNIDPFSLLLAREANVVVGHVGFAVALRRSLQSAIQLGGIEIRPTDLRKRPWLARVASWLAYGAVRLAVGIAGYGGGREYRG